MSLPDTIILWNMADGKEKKRLTLAERDEVRCLAFSADGKQLAVAYSTGGVRLWNIGTGRAFKQIAIPNGVWAVAFSSDGKTLAVGAGRCRDAF